MSRGRPGRCERALTLVEVMCAIGIAGAVLVLLMGSVTVSVRTARASTDVMRAARLSAGIEQILRRDLRAVYAAGGDGGAGLIARPADPGMETTVLRLTTTNSLAPTSGSAILRLVEYVVRPGEDASEGFDIIRRERPLAGGAEASGAVEDLLVKRVAAWEFTCYDGTAWENEWHRRTLPHAIRLSYAFSTAADATAGHAVFAPAASPGADPAPELTDSKTPAGGEEEAK